MAKLPVYQQQTKVSGAKATGVDFGSQVGQATSQLGNTLNQIGDNIIQRNEVIDRVRQANSFDQGTLQEFEAWKTNEDITNPKAVESFNATMRKRIEKTLDEHSGRTGSKAILRNHLESQYNQYSKSAITSQIKSQHTMLTNMTEQVGNTFSIAVTQAPGELDNILAEADQQLLQIYPALTEEEQINHSNSLRQKIVSGAVQGLLNQGQYGTAREIMDDDKYGKYMTPATSRAAAIAIGTGQAKVAVEEKRVARNVASFSAALGRNLSPDEMIKIKNMPDQDDMTLSDKIVQLEILTGEKITQGQVDKLAGTYIPSTGGGGGTMKERFLTTINENATGFATGSLTQEEDREFLNVVNELYGPKEITDSITGLRRTIQASMPVYVKEALAQRGVQLQGTDDQPGGQYNTDQNEQVDSGVPERTIWDRAMNIAGPLPQIANTLGKTPFIGQEFGIDPQFASDKAFVENKQRDLIRSLQNNPRFSVTEMEAIEKEVSISGSTWDNPTAYRQRIVGIDEALSNRVDGYLKSLTEGKISKTERMRLMDSVNSIQDFRDTLGVPIRVKSVEEARKLPPSTLFIDPHGVTRTTHPEQTGQ